MPQTLKIKVFVSWLKKNNNNKKPNNNKTKSFTKAWGSLHTACVFIVELTQAQQVSPALADYHTLF